MKIVWSICVGRKIEGREDKEADGDRKSWNQTWDRDGKQKKLSDSHWCPPGGVIQSHVILSATPLPPNSYVLQPWVSWTSGRKGKNGSSGKKRSQRRKRQVFTKGRIYTWQPHMEDHGEGICGENSLACQSGLLLSILSPVCALEWVRNHNSSSWVRQELLTLCHSWPVFTWEFFCVTLSIWVYKIGIQIKPSLIVHNREICFKRIL